MVHSPSIIGHEIIIFLDFHPVIQMYQPHQYWPIFHEDLCIWFCMYVHFLIYVSLLVHLCYSLVYKIVISPLNDEDRLGFKKPPLWTLSGRTWRDNVLWGGHCPGLGEAAADPSPGRGHFPRDESWGIYGHEGSMLMVDSCGLIWIIFLINVVIHSHDGSIVMVKICKHANKTGVYWWW